MKIIKITAMWCMSCLVMKNVWNKVFSNLDNVEIIDYDYDDDFEEIKNLNIGDILPVVIIYKNGLEVKRIIGEKSKKEMLKILEDLFNE